MSLLWHPTPPHVEIRSASPGTLDCTVSMITFVCLKVSVCVLFLDTPSWTMSPLLWRLLTVPKPHPSHHLQFPVQSSVLSAGPKFSTVFRTPGSQCLLEPHTLNVSMTAVTIFAQPWLKSASLVFLAFYSCPVQIQWPLATWNTCNGAIEHLKCS